MKDMLFIPDNLHVGFNKREDTYSGKLAYVIYTDKKGVKRKEASWNSWRDGKIPPEDYKNEPTTGFVLNKQVGGVRYSWSHNARNEYVRVYDPRGFEFEISVPNLLFILSNNDCYSGKGLDGEFVYAWDRTELVLLPVSCQEYKECKEFSSVQAKKVTKKDMVVGHTYQLRKDLTELVYLGRHKVLTFENNTLYSSGNVERLYYTHIDYYINGEREFRHIFYDINNDRYHLERGFTKLSGHLVDQVHDNFSDIEHNFLYKSPYTSTFKSLELIDLSESDFEKGWRLNGICKLPNGDLHPIMVTSRHYKDISHEQMEDEVKTYLNFVSKRPKIDTTDDHIMFNSYFKLLTDVKYTYSFNAPRDSYFVRSDSWNLFEGCEFYIIKVNYTDGNSTELKYVY